IYTMAAFEGVRANRAKTLTITAFNKWRQKLFLSDVGFGSSVNSDR
ncbi:hypothetical protein SAMN04488696_3000, partial [Methanolobus profundi]